MHAMGLRWGMGTNEKTCSGDCVCSTQRRRSIRVFNHRDSGAARITLRAAAAQQVCCRAWSHHRLTRPVSNVRNSSGLPTLF